MRWLAVLGLTLFLLSPARAMEPSEVMANPAQEARARTLFHELRCMVCQNESIFDSAAPLAKDLRMLVREKIAAGASDDEILRFLVDRYGDFVLLKPPFRPQTLLLWGTPLIVLVAGAAAGWYAMARRRREEASPVPLDTEEARRLELILDDTRPERS
jgi:cytochrome c-type biogenesis protein CcmH